MRALTQAVIERAREIGPYVSSEARAAQYRGLVDWLVFELGVIVGSG